MCVENMQQPIKERIEGKKPLYHENLKIIWELLFSGSVNVKKVFKINKEFIISFEF
jgi:hypothetical protein